MSISGISGLGGAYRLMGAAPQNAPAKVGAGCG